MTTQFPIAELRALFNAQSRLYSRAASEFPVSTEVQAIGETQRNLIAKLTSNANGQDEADGPEERMVEINALNLVIENIKAKSVEQMSEISTLKASVGNASNSVRIDDVGEAGIKMLRRMKVVLLNYLSPLVLRRIDQAISSLDTLTMSEVRNLIDNGECCWFD